MLQLIRTAARLQAALPKRGLVAGYAFAAVGAVLFSSKTIVIKLAFAAGADAETMQALRMIIALPIYLLIGLHGMIAAGARKQNAPRPAAVLAAAAVGVLGYYISSYLDLKGLESVSAQLERLILFTYPFFVLIFGACFFRQPFGGQCLLAVSVAYAGLGLVFASSASGRLESPFGAMLVLIAAVIFALSQLLAKRVIETMNVRLFTCIAMSAAAIAALIPFLLSPQLRLAMPAPTVVTLAGVLAIAGTVLPSFCTNAALRHISAQANAVIGGISPIATILLAVVMLGEPLTVGGALGGLLVVAGVVWFTLAERK